MITGGGKGAAYKPARATDIRGLDPLALADRFKKNSDDALDRQDAADAADAKANKEFDDSIELTDKDFVAKISTIDSFDDVNRDFANTSRDAYLDLAKKAKEYQRSGNTRDLNIVLGRMAKVKGNFKNSNTVPESLLSKVNNFNKLSKEGKLSDADSAYAKKMTDLGKFNFTIGVDENGIPEIYTPSPDGKKREKHRLSEFLTDFQPVEVYDVDNFLKNAKALETSITSGNQGGYIVTEEGISQQAKAAIEADIAAVTSGDEFMTDLLYKATGGKQEKREGFTDADRETVASFMRDKAYGLFTDKNVRKENKFALENQKAKNKAKAKKEDAPKYSFERVETIDGEAQGEITASASDLNTKKYTVTEKTTGKGLVGIDPSNTKKEMTGFVIEQSNISGDKRIVANFIDPSKKDTKQVGKFGKSSTSGVETRDLSDEEITRFMDLLRARDDQQSQSMLEEIEKADTRLDSRKKNSNSTTTFNGVTVDKL